MPLAGWEEGWMRRQDRETAERDEQDPADDCCVLTRQMAENARLSAEVARLREALQPFVDALHKHDRSAARRGLTLSDEWSHALVPTKHYRQAWRALNP